MHDLSGARQLDEDTLVVDVPDRPLPRALLEAQVVMHVRLLYGDNLKHRLLPGHLDLACGTDKLDHDRVKILPEKLDGDDYCEICFTPRERLHALEAVAKRRNDADGYETITALKSRTRTRGNTSAPKPKK